MRSSRRVSPRRCRDSGARVSLVERDVRHVAAYRGSRASSVSGVRSSCETSASIWRRRRSDVRSASVRAARSVRHAVEGAGHAGDLVAASFGRARIEIAGAEALGRLFQRAQDDCRAGAKITIAAMAVGDDQHQRPRQRQQLSDVGQDASRRRRRQHYHAAQLLPDLHRRADHRSGGRIPGVASGGAPARTAWTWRRMSSRSGCSELAANLPSFISRNVGCRRFG